MPPDNAPASHPVPDADSPAPYTLDVVAALTGISSKTIVHYHEEGLLTSIPESVPESPRFDDEALRTLRRIEHVRSSCEVNLSGLKLILSLLDEIDQLRSQLSLRR